MKKRALAILMAALTASTMFAVPTFAADYSGEDPQLEKNIKILTIWAEDNDNGMLLNKICEDYQKNVNPNFTWEYEMQIRLTAPQRRHLMEPQSTMHLIFMQARNFI